MGKPSSSQLSKTSNHSLNTATSNSKIQAPMSNTKMQAMRRKKHKKNRSKIKMLFNKLKRQSVSSLSSVDSSQNITVISLDQSHLEETENNVKNETVVKRKCESSDNIPGKRLKSDSLIVITDDDLTINDNPCLLSSPIRSNRHINCSTPINRKDSKTLENMIINNFPNSKNNTKKNINDEVINLTKEINKDSYLTIDLTADSEFYKTNNTVIDVDKSVDCVAQTSDCTLVSISNANLSMSGESDITVLENKRTSKKDKHINKFAMGISKLNSAEKGKLLELIAQNIFSGCKMPKDIKKNLSNLQIETQTQATETVEDTFIKEVILGEARSRNSIGSNIYHPSKDDKNKKGLRMIVIDGSNVAMEHTKGSMFSVKGLKICIEYFLRRGHVVKAFVPRFRCKFGKSSDPRLLDQLERQGLVVYTPSREIQGRICVPYDDRYIVQCAAEFDGVIVSGDNYRDLLLENPRWRFVIENRLLPFTWVNDMIMFPRDPLGRNGPTLEQFLKHPEISGPIVL